MAPDEKILRLNFVRTLVVLAIAIGYASTMPIGPDAMEAYSLFGYEPSWMGIQVMFFFSGFLALASLQRHRSVAKYLVSKALRNGPLLFLFTLISVIVIYPIFGNPSGQVMNDAAKLTRYFFDTVSCINPGRPLPGLLDDAKYMCLIQGAIWTLRWGLLAHIGAAIGWRIGLFSRPQFIAFMALISTAAYFSALMIYVYTNNSLLETPLIGLRLAYPFAIGMTVFAYKDKMPETLWSKIGWLSAIGIFTAINALFLRWTPIIEIGLTLFWSYAAYMMAFSKTPAFQWTERCPHLALGLYLVMWPTAQILLLLNPQITPTGLILLTVPLSLVIAGLAQAAIYGPVNIRLQRKLRPEIAVQTATL